MQFSDPSKPPCRGQGRHISGSEPFQEGAGACSPTESFNTGVTLSQLQDLLPHRDKRHGAAFRTNEETREYMWRGHSTGGEGRSSVCAESSGTQEMEDSGRKAGFISSITQAQFLLLGHFSNSLQGG